MTELSTTPDTTHLTHEERVNHILERRRQGTPFATIGAELGITRQTAHEHYWKAMEARTAHNVAAIRAEQNERLDFLHEKAMEIVNRKHVTVSGGKVVHHSRPKLNDDGSIVVDENGEPVLHYMGVIEDDGPTLRAIAELRQIEETRAKLNGTYAPVQASINGSIEYSFVGIDLDKLR